MMTTCLLKIENMNYIYQKLRAWFYFKSIKRRFETLGKIFF